MKKAIFGLAGGLAAANATFMLVALERHPYRFYQDLRLATLLLSLILIWCLVVSGWRWWPGAVAAIAVLFNPVAPFHMSRSTWHPINLSAALVFIALAFLSFREAARSSE